jgi:hypothetical protein
MAATVARHAVNVILIPVAVLLSAAATLRTIVPMLDRLLQLLYRCVARVDHRLLVTAIHRQLVSVVQQLRIISVLPLKRFLYAADTQFDRIVHHNLEAAEQRHALRARELGFLKWKPFTACPVMAGVSRT